ncbi:MAG: hypothetical protein F4X57_10375 [Chloroflexi bacterium]|nr:hypothetical protein [Chloroflexota bacterium]
MRRPLPLVAALLLGLLAAGLAALPAPAAAQTSTNPSNYDADGDGLIEIGSLTQLDAVRYDLDGNGASSNTAYAAAFPVADGGSVCPSGATCTGYELTADLDFDTGTAGDRTDDAYYDRGKGWQPIGSNYSRFTGVFDGGGHTIANLFINRSTRDYVGLFGIVGSSGKVRNLGLTGVSVTGAFAVGGLAGYNNSGTISASYATGSVSGTLQVGGLAGRNSGTISASYATGTVSGTGYPGGLVGWNSFGGTISASYATGTVSGTGNNVGGLAGDNDLGTISASYATGTVGGTLQVGGLAGRNSGTISASYATGTVSGTRNNVGGLAGRNSGTISASYFDTQTSGLAVAVGNDDADNSGAIDGTETATAGAEGKTTSELMPPTGYAGIYSGWNLDLDGDSQPDSPWDFGTASQYPALKADFNGDETPTWQEFGYQVRKLLPLSAMASNDWKALLSWPDITESAWTKTPEVSYALYRDGAAVTDYDGSSRSYTDSGLTDKKEYAYQVVLLLNGGEARRSNEASIVAENRLGFGEETIDAQTFTENADVGTVTLPEATGGDAPLTYSLTPELPAGLSFDAASRTISGTPSEPQDAIEYTYKVTNEASIVAENRPVFDADDDTASLTFTIAIANNPPVFGAATIDAQSYTENADVGTLTLPEATGGDGALAYALTLDLPAGLAFDAAARTISGTPTESQAETEYTYTATDDDGETAELTFTIEVEVEPVAVTETAIGEGYDTLINAAEAEDGIALTGKATPGASVSVSYDGQVLATTTADPETGEWSVVIPADSLPEGAVTVAVAASMEDGRSAEVDYQFSIDRIAPEVTPVELVMSPTNDYTPEVVISSSEPGTVVYGGNCGDATPAAIATADTDTWLTYPQLPDGEYSGCSIAVTDAAGNTGHPAVHPSFWDIVVDTQAPVLESSTVDPSGDIVLRFWEEISWFKQPDIGAFTVLVDGSKEVTEVVFLAIGWHGTGHDWTEVLLELSRPVPEGAARVVVTYHHVDTLSPLQDHAGNLFPSGDYQVSLYDGHRDPRGGSRDWLHGNAGR